MEEKIKHIVVIAGEASGDMHAAHLVDEMKHLNPSLTFSGLGGESMKQCGVELYHDMTKLAVIGFVEVLKHYGEIKRIFERAINEIKERKPACVILVDYPGFNLRLAKELKKLSAKVIYYISPQVWAWKKNRVRQIKKNVDKMLVIFQFEKDFYARLGMDVTFVGHPLMDSMEITVEKDKFLTSHGLEEYRLTVGLLPGSREKEIQRILPLMLGAVRMLQEKYPMLQFLIVKAPTIEATLIQEELQKAKMQIKIIEEDRYNAIHTCDLCLVASGTATLETALLLKPMVVVYKTSFLTWLLAKLFVTIPDIGLVNVVAGKRIVPECIQFQATGKQIAQELENIFKDEVRIARIKSELGELKRSLDVGGASQRAAEEILRFLKI
ncbi:MAG TPA: lipid-A-disaccharide synthase [Candidatus Omnitrophota bacterium]|nr:lipid-A-disaccharide synthase [Candidatus Omnitrophota bacterium]